MEDARVLLRIIGKSLRFSGNREQKLARKSRWCKQQLRALEKHVAVCVCMRVCSGASLATAWGAVKTRLSTDMQLDKFLFEVVLMEKYLVKIKTSFWKKHFYDVSRATFD